MAGKSKDLNVFPEFTFTFVEHYIQQRSGSSGKSQMGKGYKYFSEGYIHGLKLIPTGDEGCVRVTAGCYRSQRKNESPHKIEISFTCTPLAVEAARCSCTIGQSQCCGHVTGVLYQLANYKSLGVSAIPDDVCKTSLPQTWHLPRGEKIRGAKSDNIVVQGYDAVNPTRCTRGVQSNLYNPIRTALPPIDTLTRTLTYIRPDLLLLTVCTNGESEVQTEFGTFPKGSALSYQQSLPAGTIISDDNGSRSFPDLPLRNSIGVSTIPADLNISQTVNLSALSVTEEESIEIEMSTRTQSADPKWRKVRQSRLTASIAGTIIKKKSGFERYANYLKNVKKVTTGPMRHGLACEPTAAQAYVEMQDTTTNIFPCGVIISPHCCWLGASPDRKVFSASRDPPYGLLEIKCPTIPKSRLDYLHLVDGEVCLKKTHNIYYQIQMQLAVTGLIWCDLFVWHDEYHHLETVYFDENGWNKTCKPKLDNYFFRYFLK